MSEATPRNAADITASKLVDANALARELAVHASTIRRLARARKVALASFG